MSARNRSTWPLSTDPTGVDLSRKEAESYNLCRAFNAIAEGTWGRKGCLEREVSDAVAARLDASPRSLFMPMNIRAAVTGNIAGTSSLGGAAVETQIMGFIEMLRAKAKVVELGGTMLGGLRGNVAIPRQTSANTWNWVGENPSSGNPLTALTIDQVPLSPKVGMGSTAYSRQALAMLSPDMNNLVINDLATVSALAIDNAALNGLGSANQPRGLRNTSGVNEVVLGANGGVMDWASIVGFETHLALDNADAGNLAFLTTPGVRGALKQILKNTTSGSQMLWEEGQLGGYRAEVSTQMPSNLTKGTSTTICHAAIFGDWSQLLIGEWGGALDLLVDPFTYASQGMIAVHAYAMVDVAVRQPTAFAKCEDILLA